MLFSLLKTLHILACLLWVGGMFFAYVALRPVAAQLLELPLRLQLWVQVFKKFFPWVWVAIFSLLVTGIGIIHLYGGMAQVQWHVHLMLLTGLSMMVIFIHIFFILYQRLQEAVKTQDWQTGGLRLGQIRRLIGINLTLGLVTVVIASLGKSVFM
ncbi:putative integral membrane protein [Beggiatoa alba B18LD]|uniref:Putative integral membrane protein n=1 Tax=Beggiatoa alba B18LD TaxID=395493 RepID=I3CCA4_9GAMM|nr:CopD family protein [Beggiatoa alba]EIJ41247.1 putative integral membrane protein [Beggiatoa alba B18LD]